MGKKDLTAFIALLAATAVFMGMVHVKAPASRYVDKNAISGKEEALDISGAENITKAVKVLNKDGSEAGYIVTVEEAGFGGTIVMEVAVDASKTEVLSINVTEQSETPGLGGRVTEDEFRAQFAGIEAPVYLPGMLVKEEAKTPVTADGLKDGVYTVESEEFDGYKDVLELTVADGKIKGIVWDSVDADGVGKSVLSEQGVYVMTEDGLTWKEQAEALAAAVIENQSVECLSLNEQGKTDAVSGVSIYVGGFVNVLTEALEQAAGKNAMALADGEYKAEAQDGDYTNVVTMTVENGQITAVTMDAVDAEGNGKCLLSEQGVYVMTEDGLSWKEQAEAVAKAIIDNQSTGFLNIDEQGKTDAVSGVSMAVGGFVNLLEDLMEQAAGVVREEVPAEPEVPAAPEQGTVVDGISGATISSTAVVNGVNRAVEFLNQL